MLVWFCEVFFSPKFKFPSLVDNIAMPQSKDTLHTSNIILSFIYNKHTFSPIKKTKCN